MQLCVWTIVTIQYASRRGDHESKHTWIHPWSCWETSCYPSFWITIPTAPAEKNRCFKSFFPGESNVKLIYEGDVMKTQTGKRLIELSKRVLFLVLAGISIIVGWLSSLVFVFVVPLMMLSWVIVTLTWCTWGAFTFCCCQTSDLHSACSSVQRTREAI